VSLLDLETRYNLPMSNRFIVSVVIVVALVGGYFLYRGVRPRVSRSGTVMEWLRHPNQHPDWAMQVGERCGDAPFIFPTDGLIGFLWDDSFQVGHRHQGLDIFGGGQLNQTPVVAAYDGYLTRLPEWKSAVILRVPSDPLNPSRQIWLYFTHMADKDGNSFISPDFPPGTYEQFIPAGTFLGRQGNYSGDPNNPTGVHLHFSIVLDDGQGHFRNELDINNTLDPTPYLGIEVNANRNQGEIPLCQAGVNG
jgi:hypothetical protein